MGLHTSGSGAGEERIPRTRAMGKRGKSVEGRRVEEGSKNEGSRAKTSDEKGVGCRLVSNGFDDDGHN